MPDDDYEKRKSSELMTLYSSCVSEIATFKQQQWRVTNYGLVLYAALVSIPKLLNNPTNGEIFILWLVATAVAVMGIFVVNQLHDSIYLRRRRLTYIRDHFVTVEFLSAWRYRESEKGAPDIPEEKPNLQVLFWAVLVTGYVATSWLLHRSMCFT